VKHQDEFETFLFQKKSTTKGGSLSELYQKHSQALYWTCMRFTRNTEDAKDMVHQVFIKAQLHGTSFKGQSHVYTWIPHS
jgi:DNA-directed RNA polymerase specialized sigma24 family protein